MESPEFQTGPNDSEKYFLNFHSLFLLFTALQKGELPPGRTVASSSSTPYPFQDPEIERELKELRQKAKDF